MMLIGKQKVQNETIIWLHKELHRIPLTRTLGWYKIKPREKALQKGVEALSDCELLALLLKTGTKNFSVFDLAKTVLEKYGTIKNILDAPLSGLMETKGIGKIKALEIKSVLEFNKRYDNSEIFRFTNFQNLHRDLRPAFKFLTQEKLVVIGMNKQNNIIVNKVIYIGDSCSTHLSPRDIARSLINIGASKCIVVHNHPSQDSDPSVNDIIETKKLNIALNYIGIKLVEHMIFCDKSFHLIISGKKVVV